MIYYDYILGLESSVYTCRVMVSLHSQQTSRSDRTSLPEVYCEPSNSGDYYQQGYNKAVLGAQQPVPRSNLL